MRNLDYKPSVFRVRGLWQKDHSQWMACGHIHLLGSPCLRLEWHITPDGMRRLHACGQSSGTSAVWRQCKPWTTITEKELVGSSKSCSGCSEDPQGPHWAQQWFVLCLLLRRVKPLQPNRLVEVNTGQQLREKSCAQSQSDS